MTVAVSVVIPVYNGGRTLGACLNAICGQSLYRDTYEVILVDDGSTDNTADVASRYSVRLIAQQNQGAPAARNRGIQHARGFWVAFTDADCIPSRNWLKSLLAATGNKGNRESVLGVAGRIMGYRSETEASRFVDMSGGLDSQRHLSHPKYPFAVFGNIMYRRDSLLTVGNLDPRFYAYDACDLHTRLLRQCPGEFRFEPKAVVLHLHRPDWRAYWRQQLGYGRGLGQFYWKYRKEIRWSFVRELNSWLALAPLALAAGFKGQRDTRLIHRGRFIKNMAQRIGFVQTYWSRAERKRW